MVSTLWRAAALLLLLPSLAVARQLNMTEGVTPVSREIFDLHMFVMAICAGIAAVVYGVLIFTLIRHRKSRGAVAAALLAAGFPEFFQVVERPGLRQHQVHDDVVQVDQHPLGLAVALHAQGLYAGFLGLHDEILGHRLDVAHRAARGDHEHVRERVLPGYVDVLDVDGFEVFQGGRDQVPELLERQVVLYRRLNRQMNGPWL